MIEQLVVVGDSHTRSYTKFQNIYPFFLGPGKEYNLSDKQFKKIINKIELFFNKYGWINNENTLFLFSFGEADCRYLLSGDWHISTRIAIENWKNIQIYDKEKEVEKLIENYTKVIDVLKKYTENYFILTPTTAFFPTYNYMTTFNRLLNQTFKENVLDLYSKISKPNINIYSMEKYDRIICWENLCDDINYDPIHLNHHIISILLNILASKIIINSDDYRRTNILGNKYYFVKHKKFNTYLI